MFILVTYMLSSRKIVNIIRSRDRDLNALGVKRIGLFGSYARGQERPGSDVDILVEFRPGHATYDNLLALHDILTELIGPNVDLVTMGGLSRYFKEIVLKEVMFVDEAAS